MMLPSDRYLADVLGLTEEQYRHFQIELRKRAAEGPQPSVVAGLETATVIAIAQFVIGVGSLVISAFLKPTLPQANQAPGQPRQQQQTTDPVIRNTSFAPRFGFDSQQDISTLGSTIPLVYAKREEISGTTYGGIRINTPMIWNQILSLGGAQLLRAVFLLSESNIQSVDATNFGIGSNTIQGYLFDNDTITQAASRLAIYFSSDGGRIAGTDRVTGRSNATDAGSSSSTDVFQVFRGGQNEQDFCASSRPSTQTTFGVYSPIGNNLMYKVNPVLRPGVRSQLRPQSGSALVQVRCRPDTQQMNERDKFRAPFTSLSGLVNDSLSTDSATRTAAVGDTLTYKIFRDSHKNIVFNNYTIGGTDNDDVTALDIASTVASRQKTWDDSLVVGEVYKIGACLAVCTSRTNDPFVSGADFPSEDDDNSGTTVEVAFEVIRSGQIKEHTSTYLRNRNIVLSGQLSQIPNREVGTTGGHIFKYAAANVATARPCLAVEIGLRSVLGARINGLCNFQETKTYDQIDNDFCQAFENNDPEEILNVFNQSGVITAPFQRYSFFRIKWRVYGSPSWNSLADTYGVRSESQQAIFNYIRFEFATEKRREFMFEPVTGYEVRNNLDGGTTLYVLDYKKAAVTVSDASGCSVVFAGSSVARSSDTFSINEGIGVSELNEIYAYTEDTNTRTGPSAYSAELLTAFTIPLGQSISGSFNLDVEIDPGDSNQGIYSLPLLQGETVDGSFNATQGGTPVTISGSVTRLNGLPDQSANFSFQAGSPVTADTSFAVGETFSADPSANNFIRIYKGLQKTDTSSYVDDFAKLSEAFVYSEITTTAEGSPEHEIVYVNEIVPNSTAPLYDDLALVGINIRSSAEFQQFAQFSTYVTGGKVCNLLPLSGGTTGATHLFPEVLYDLLTNTRYGAGSFIKADMIDADSFAAAAQWCQARRYFYDAAIAEQINIRQFAADLSATHLLQFGESDGKYFLNTALPVSGSNLQVTAPIAGLFTAGNIAEDSFQLQYFDPEERDPIQISVRYREERPSTDLTSPGLFPVVREVLVREDVPEASETDPTEQVDVSDFCTSREHAIDAAKFLIRMRRIPTHTISFATTHDAVISSLAPGDYIKVAMDETEYDEFNNGVVTPEGALVSTKALADGTYNVVAWDGTEGTPPADTTLTVSNGGKTASPTGVVFTVKLPSTQIRVYQIERISPTDDGTFTIEALHMPVNSSGILLVADGFDTASNWVIEG